MKNSLTRFVYVTKALLISASFSFGETLLIPVKSPTPSAMDNSVRNIRDGLNLEDLPPPKAKMTPLVPEESSTANEKIEVKALVVDASVSDFKKFKTLTAKEMPPASVTPATVGQSKSLVLFYAISGSGAPVEVKFYSTLSVPGSVEMARTASVEVPSDGKIRIAPLFFSTKILPVSPSGEYRMSWRVESAKADRSAEAAASFKKVARSESRSTSFEKTTSGQPQKSQDPFISSSENRLTEQRDTDTRFKPSGVGILPKRAENYKFKDSTPAPKSTPRSKSTPKPTPKQNKPSLIGY